MAKESSTVNDYMAALGGVAVSATTMEHFLREAFCSLIGSKFAAVVAGGQAVAWLIDQCEALTGAHRELPRATRDSIGGALRLCHDANGRRNDLMHGLKAPTEIGLETIRSRRHTHVLAKKAWPLSEIKAVSHDLAVAGFGLHAAMVDALGQEVVDVGEALRREGGMT